MDLLEKVARQEAEALPRLHRGSRRMMRETSCLTNAETAMATAR